MYDTKQLKYDVAVIGGGPGGIPAAIAAARMGMTTALLTAEWPASIIMVSPLGKRIKQASPHFPIIWLSFRNRKTSFPSSPSEETISFVRTSSGYTYPSSPDSVSSLEPVLSSEPAGPVEVCAMLPSPGSEPENSTSR